MDVIYWLIPLSIAILGIAIAVFFWAVRSGQFQDLDSPAVDILFDDDLPKKPASTSESTTDPSSEPSTEAPAQPQVKGEVDQQQAVDDRLEVLAWIAPDCARWLQCGFFQVSPCAHSLRYQCIVLRGEH